jgi:hypothetical protein
LPNRLLFFSDSDLARFDDQQMACKLIFGQFSQPFGKLAIHLCDRHFIWEADNHNATMTADWKMQDIAEPQIACHQYGAAFLGKLENNFIVRPAKPMIPDVLDIMPKPLKRLTCRAGHILIEDKPHRVIPRP